MRKRTFIRELTEGYKSLAKYLAYYWKIYGSWLAFCTSPLLHISILLAIAVVILLKYNSSCPPVAICWYDVTITIIPAMLGFTLAAFAAFVSFGSQSFIETLAGDYSGQEKSPFMKTSVKFFHFIIVQIVVLIFAVISKIIGASGLVVSTVGWVGLFYSLLSGFGAALAIFHISDLFDYYADKRKQRD